eukprot:jgi/Picre1/27665/NNA_000629.t1
MLQESVDSILRGEEPETLIRSIGSDKRSTPLQTGVEAREELLGSRGILNSTRILMSSLSEEAGPVAHEPRLEKQKKQQIRKKQGLQVYIEGVEKEVIDEITKELERETRLNIIQSLDDADAVLTSRAALKSNEWLKEVAKCSKIPLFLVRSEPNPPYPKV